MKENQPITNSSRSDDSFRIGSCGAEAFPKLLKMYDAFFPEAVWQGVPPTNEQARKEWVAMLLRDGENIIASLEGELIGHCAIMPDYQKKDGEFIIFVVGPHRRLGVGSELTRASLIRAKDIGLETVWLTVESGNFRAIRLYKKFGFTFLDTGIGERTMALQL